MLTIGEFSRICFVTKKTLRHYDEIGLLSPEHVAENGYRYYTAGQLRTMLLIARLKSYGFSLPEIAAVLASPGREQLARRLQEKRAAMEAERRRQERLLRQLDGDIEKLKRSVDILELDFAVKTAERNPVQIYGIRKIIDIKYFSEMFGQLFFEVGQKQLQPVGPPMAFYHGEDFSREACDVEVALPVKGAPDGSRELAGGLHCFVTLVGPYEDATFTAAYAALAKWVEENGYHISNAPFDVYVKGGEGVSPQDYVTEIYFPIAK